MENLYYIVHVSPGKLSSMKCVRKYAYIYSRDLLYVTVSLKINSLVNDETLKT